MTPFQRETLRIAMPYLATVVLLVISVCTGGVIMFFYSFLLIVLNRGALPDAIKPAPWRVATLVWSTLFFGTLAALTIWQQLARFR